MKHAIFVAVLLAGCGRAEQPAAAPEPVGMCVEGRIKETFLMCLELCRMQDAQDLRLRDACTNGCARGAREDMQKCHDEGHMHYQGE